MEKIINSIDGSKLIGKTVKRKGDKIIGENNKVISGNDAKLTNSDFLIELMRKLTETITDEDKKQKYLNKDRINSVICVKFNANADEDTNFKEVRRQLYKNGFNIGKTHYRFLCRSSSNGRVKKTLFINDKLYPHMINWLWLGKNPNKIKDNPNIANFLSYESLALSSLQDSINIEPKNILLVDDKQSVFTKKFKVVTRDLEVIEEDREVENELFDGESLIDYRLLNGKSMALLRKRWFKSCAFATDIQKFFTDNNITVVRDMFGNEMQAKDVKLITTPNSLKFLKLSFMFKSEKECYNWWKDRVGGFTGICKTDHENKLGTYRNLSYQMLQAMDISDDDLKTLLEPTFKFTELLKNKPSVFMQYIKDNDYSESRKILSDLTTINGNVLNLKVFKKYKDYTINNLYLNQIKTGRINIDNTDYYTIVSNPYELLLHCICKFTGDSFTLKDNECYCKHFAFNTTLGAIRNPCISRHNTSIYNNTYNELIDRYFKFDGNIIAVNNINCDYSLREEGRDNDSDTLCVTDNKIIVNAMLKNIDQLTVYTDITPSKKLRSWNSEDIAEIDNIIGDNLIGRIVNTSARLDAQYWDNLHNNNIEMANYIDNLICKCDILSQLEIDKAKKIVEIDTDGELKKIDKDDLLETDRGKLVNPYFMKFLGKKNCIRFNCTIDNLCKIIENNTVKAQDNFTIAFKDLLKDYSINSSKINYKQVQDIVVNIQAMQNSITRLRVKAQNTQNGDYKKELLECINTKIRGFKSIIDKKEINRDTLRYMLNKLETDYKSFILLFITIFIDRIKEELLEDKPIKTLTPCLDGDIEIWGKMYK